MDARPSPSSDSRTSTPEPRAFKDRKEALEAFKDLLREKVQLELLLKYCKLVKLLKKLCSTIITIECTKQF